MKKAMIILVVILLAFLLLGELTASTLPKSLIPADAEWVVHLDMAKFKSTRIGHLLIQEKQGGIKKKAKVFYKRTSIDLLQDVTGVTISRKLFSRPSGISTGTIRSLNSPHGCILWPYGWPSAIIARTKPKIYPRSPITSP
jgi:hypothetical protein